MKITSDDDLRQLAMTVFSSNEKFNEMRSDPLTVRKLATELLSARQQIATLTEQLKAAEAIAEKLDEYADHDHTCNKSIVTIEH
jgi:hypothetical protein